MTPAGVIDACAFHDVRSTDDLLPYLGSGWSDLLAIENVKARGEWQNHRPFVGDALPEDPDAFLARLDAQPQTERVVLGYHEGLLAAGLPSGYKARAIVRALNDWTIDRWLERDDRLYGHVLVRSAEPDEAAREIRRVGAHEKIVAVALGPNGLNQPFGHLAYGPIYDAAAELGLPVVLQAGADNVADLGTAPTSIGLTATYAEYEAMAAAPLITHLTSLVSSGVFDRHRDLRLLVLGGGLAWVPQLLWRLDPIYRVVRRVDMPWSDRLPSEIFAEHVRLGTYSLESPPAAELAALFGLIPDVESLLLYTSGYPSAGWETAERIAERVPVASERLLAGNARDLYRWPAAASLKGGDAGERNLGMDKGA